MEYHPSHPMSLFKDKLDPAVNDPKFFEAFDQLPSQEAHDKLLANGWAHVDHSAEADGEPDGSVFVTLWSSYAHPELGEMEMESTIATGPKEGDPFTFQGDTADVVSFVLDND